MLQLYAFYAAADRLTIIPKGIMSFETVTSLEFRTTTELCRREYLTNNRFRRCM